MQHKDIHKSKKKTTDAASDKKEKKGKKKLKRIAKDKSVDKELERSNTPPLETVSATSISDVFADHLIQKAKTTFDEPIVMKTKSEHSVAKSRYDDDTNDNFDIPTISEIAKSAVEKVVCRKEFTELEELQKKINQAKRQLRQITDESEDDDFINLRADKHDLETVHPHEEVSGESIHLLVDSRNAALKIEEISKSKTMKAPITFSESKETGTDITDEKRPSIHDRLGNRPRKENVISLSANRRIEQALYVPSYRRNESEKEIQFESDRHSKKLDEYTSSKTDTDDELNRKSRIHRDQNLVVTDLREKVQTKRLNSEKSVRSSILNRVQAGLGSIDKRIGSRIIVAPLHSKVVIERKKDAVSSVVNIQPRPVVPKSKQACKSLLLRAVAEAQKSTALVKLTRDPQSGSNRMPKEPNIKSHAMDKMSPKRNIIIEVETNAIDMETIDLDGTGIKEEYTNKFIEEEYDPNYEPHLINRDLNARYVPYCKVYLLYYYNRAQIRFSSLNIEIFLFFYKISSDIEKRTQFVVTLDSRRDFRSYDMQKSTSNTEPKKEITKRKRTLSPSNAGKPVNKLIIQNDTEDEEELRKEIKNSVLTPTKPNKKSNDEIEPDHKRVKRENNRNKEKITGPDSTASKPAESDECSGKSGTGDLHKIRTSKSSGNKYENLPSRK